MDQVTAQSMIAMCAIVNGYSPTEYYTQPNPPGNWQSIYTPDKPIGPFNNSWQLWQNGTENEYAVVFQGTQPNAMSILEDLLFPMVQVSISATSILGSVDLALPQAVADSSCEEVDVTNGGVHVGFLAGTLLMLPDVLTQLIAKVSDMSSATVHITGHSMGAAIATQFTSLIAQMRQHPIFLIGTIPTWDTYVFAQPKPGDNYYADEVNYNFSNLGVFNRVVQNLDWVPQSPLTIELLSDLPEPNPSQLLEQEIAQKFPSVEAILQYLSGKADSLLSELDSFLNTELSKLLSSISSDAITFSGKLDLVPTLNFTSSGSPVALMGNKSPATNPADPDDFMWQHHAANYYWLLSDYWKLPTNPANPNHT